MSLNSVVNKFGFIPTEQNFFLWNLYICGELVYFFNSTKHEKLAICAGLLHIIQAKSFVVDVIIFSLHSISMKS